jgi:hypothetical protein
MRERANVSGSYGSIEPYRATLASDDTAYRNHGNTSPQSDGPSGRVRSLWPAPDGEAPRRRLNGDGLAAQGHGDGAR